MCLGHSQGDTENVRCHSEAGTGHLVSWSEQSEFRGKNLPGGGYMLFANTVHQSESSYGDLRASGLLGAYRSVLVARAGETEGRPRGLDCPDYALAWACGGPQEKFQNSFFVY